VTLLKKNMGDMLFAPVDDQSLDATNSPVAGMDVLAPPHRQLIFGQGVDRDRDRGVAAKVGPHKHLIRVELVIERHHRASTIVSRDNPQSPAGT
jgi:hypothetical protein